MGSVTAVTINRGPGHSPPLSRFEILSSDLEPGLCILIWSLTNLSFVEFLNTANTQLLQEENTVNLVLGRRLAVVAVLLAMFALPLTSFAADAAADLYKSKCAMCHGTDGKKMAGTREFASPEVQKMTDAELAATITNGKPPKMPAYKGKLTDDQIKDIVKYVRTLK
jgi:cytochrome c6